MTTLTSLKLVAAKKPTAQNPIQMGIAPTRSRSLLLPISRSQSALEVTYVQYVKAWIDCYSRQLGKFHFSKTYWIHY